MTSSAEVKVVISFVKVSVLIFCRPPAIILTIASRSPPSLRSM